MSAPDQFELKHGYAVFRPVGPASVATVLDLLDHAMKSCHAHLVTRLLVDASQLYPGPLSTTDWFHLSAGLAAFWDRGIRLAVVGREDQLDRERFGVLVAQNRGLYYQLYTDEAAALRWLLLKTASPKAR